MVQSITRAVSILESRRHAVYYVKAGNQRWHCSTSFSDSLGAQTRYLLYLDASHPFLVIPTYLSRSIGLSLPYLPYLPAARVLRCRYLPCSRRPGHCPGGRGGPTEHAVALSTVLKGALTYACLGRDQNTDTRIPHQKPGDRTNRPPTTDLSRLEAGLFQFDIPPNLMFCFSSINLLVSTCRIPNKPQRLPSFSVCQHPFCASQQQRIPPAYQVIRILIYFPSLCRQSWRNHLAQFPQSLRHTLRKLRR
ncbi:hypothetical protein F5B21DRAFT_386465 [Xylaria acuta]|nr:hypothetical protein F5B21DRAFT_386465 [Xylaria acuta]